MLAKKAAAFLCGSFFLMETGRGGQGYLLSQARFRYASHRSGTKLA